ncbi:type III effector Hop protein [Pseudomonas luteola]|uniref:Type III effector Hop protein n=1 Tax=Pseudomonas luteola TaxID=47886 RepID=A0A2X2CRA9_PSELU|nr:RAQPRD family integrative conjugative element protein [Pseudomonas luteola]SPZ02565.1 type III effector Hop protein [Pseudomonas luteola]
MSNARLLSSNPLLLCSFLYVLSTGFNLACAEGTASEQTNLELMLRQLESVERVAKQSSSVPEREGARYHFDYERLQKDLELIHQGIKSHLSPSRAQPRDPGQLSGHYTRTGGPMP